MDDLAQSRAHADRRFLAYGLFRVPVRQAAAAGIPIAAVNLGRTRADDLLTLKVQERCEAALAFLL